MRARLPDLVLAIGLVVILVFPFAARAAEPEGLQPADAAVELPPLVREPSGTLRSLPTGDPSPCGVALDAALAVEYPPFPGITATQAELEARDDEVADQKDRALATAVAACPGDPTARWVAGRSAAGRWISRTLAATPDSVPPNGELEAALAEFRTLQAELPGAAAGWAGEADALVAAGDAVKATRPFTAAVWYRRAEALLGRAAQLDDDPGIRIGQARVAERRLGDVDPETPDTVGALARAALEGSDAPAVVAAAAQVYEDAGTWSDAADLLVGLGPANLVRDPTAGPLEASIQPSLGLTASGTEEPAYLPKVDAVLDLSFIPRVRDGASDRGVRPPGVGECGRVARTLLLAGRGVEAAASLADTGCDIEPQESAAFALVDPSFAPTPELLVDPPTGPVSIEALPPEQRWVAYDTAQTLLRWAGDLDRAATIIDQWHQREPDSVGALHAAGEVAFRLGRVDDAARWFRQAADATDPVDPARSRARLSEGAALFDAERLDEAEDVLNTAVEEAAAAPRSGSFPTQAYTAPAGVTSSDPEVTAAYAEVQLAQLAMRRGRFEDAVDLFARSRERRPPGPPPIESFPRVIATANNEALALLELGRVDDAGAAAADAVAADPENPIARQTAGAVAVKAGDLEGAEAAFRAGLASDPTSYPLHNDLGVVLAQRGELAEAVEHFRAAIGVEGDGGFNIGFIHQNLGLALAQQGVGQLLASQAALGEAERLDPGLRGEDPELRYDDQIRFLDLDVSDVPAGWTYATTKTRGAVGLAGVAALAIVLNVVIAVGKDHGTGEAASRAAEKATRVGQRRGWSWLRADPHPAWAIAMTFAVFVGPVVFRDVFVAPTFVLALGVVVLMGAYLRARRLVTARHPAPVQEFTWMPSMAASGIALAASSLVASLAGWAFAPLPPARSDQPIPRMHRAAPLVLVVLAAVLTIVGAITRVPLTRVTATAAVVMAASVLVPIGPLDGTTAARGRTGLVISGSMLLLAALGALSLL